MEGVSKHSYFDRVRERSRIGPQSHVVLRPRAILGHILDHEVIKELRREVQHFAAEAGVTDLIKSGMRMVIEIAGPKLLPEVHLFAGQGSHNAMPQDWLSDNAQWDPNEHAPFFDLCVEAAKARLDQMKFGNRMLYHSADSEVFGVMDGDPKADMHFLILSSSMHHTMLDNSFDDSFWIRFLQSAFHIQKFLKFDNSPTRMIVNTGNGFQNGPRVHMHVLCSDEGFPGLSPQDYGFTIGPDGKIISPGSIAHNGILKMIEDRAAIQGFTPEALEKKKEANKVLFRCLQQI